jgi:hypothetical protein
MSSTATSSPPIPAARPRRTGIAASSPHHRWSADAWWIAGLAGLLAVLAAVTWRKWGVPEIDAGAELTTADRVARGGVLYHDVRYYYGPLGLYLLAGTFRVLGTSFTVAYLFGFAQTIGILGATYALARRWVTPAYAAATTAVTMTIGFSGTAFNFVLPHSNSATFGLLLVMLMLLALAHDKVIWAGLALGLVGLTRPEFAGAAWVGCGACIVAQWRMQSRASALRAAVRLGVPGIAIPLVVLGAFAASVGASHLLWDNLWPKEFIRIAGFKTQSDWMPFTGGSAFALALRAALYVGALVAVVRAAEGWPQRDGAIRLLALWPLLAFAAAIALADGAARAFGLFDASRSAVEAELHHFMLTMSWLPALGLAAAAVAGRRLLQRGASPLSGRWPADAALIAVAVLLGLRAYNEFTTEGSYAPYYAAPLVVLLGILHQRIAQTRPITGRWPLVFLLFAALGLGTYAIGGLYDDESAVVHTPRGSFVTTPGSADATSAAVAEIGRLTKSGDAIFAGPADGGLYFMSDRRPALYEVMTLPGLLATVKDQRRAIGQLRAARAQVAVVGLRDFSVWGWKRFGVDYNRAFGDFLRASTVHERVIGSASGPAAAGTAPSGAFQIRTLRFGP